MVVVIGINGKIFCVYWLGMVLLCLVGVSSVGVIGMLGVGLFVNGKL